MPKLSDKKKSIRKELILKAAFECFCEKGFEKTTMRDIFDKSGLSAGGVYIYFSSKEDMLKHLVDAGKWHFKKVIENVPNDENQIESILKKLAYLIDKKGGDEGIKLDIGVLGASLSDKDLRQLTKENMNYNISLFTKLITRDTQQNQDPNVSEIRARLIIALIQGLSIQKMIDPSFSMQKAIDNYISSKH